MKGVAMVRVLAILPNDQAIVSTRELYRIVKRSTGEPVAELLESDEAIAHLAGYADAGGDQEIVARYSQTYDQAQFDAEYSGHAPAKRPRPEVLAILPGCVVVSSQGLRRVQVEPRERGDGPTHLLAELASKAEAKRVAAKFTNRVDAREASIVRYDDVAPSGFAVDVARGSVVDASGDVEDAGDATGSPVASENAEQQSTAAD